MVIPEPPAGLSQWLTIVATSLGILVIVVPRLRTWVIRPLLRPILELLEQHEQQHAQASATGDLVARELLPNGEDWRLAEAERNEPMRTLVVRARVDQLEHNRMLADHLDWSRETIAQLNVERAGSGLAPLPAEGAATVSAAQRVGERR